MPAETRQKTNGKTLIGPKNKIAFVCSGGATKAGAFHVGVALALQEIGFQFYGGIAPTGTASIPKPGPRDISTYVGSSAGSIISSYFAAGYSLDAIFNSFFPERDQNLDESVKPLSRLTYQTMFNLQGKLPKDYIHQLFEFKTLAKDLLHADIESLLKFNWLKLSGIFSTKGVERYIREEVMTSNRFQDYLADLFIVATQLNHSRKVVFGKYAYQPPPHDMSCEYSNDVSISDACAASTALPFIFSPYEIKGPSGKAVHYIDGEIRDTLSSHVAIDAGADLVFASFTHQPYHYRRTIGSLTQFGLPAVVIQAIYLLIEQKIHNYVHYKTAHGAAIDAVAKYCKEQGVDPKHRDEILRILQKELHHRMNVDVIYIHPHPSDVDLFFQDHFSLSPKKLLAISKSGFRAAAHTLKKYEFADLPRKKLAIGSVF